LLWQAHEAITEAAKEADEAYADRVVLHSNLSATIEIIDRMQATLKNHEPVPCKNTTMPPCTDNAWRHFLEHVQECYLPQTPPAAQEPVAWRVYDPVGRAVVYSFRAPAQDAADNLDWSIEPLYRAPTLTDDEWAEIEGMISYYQEIAEFNDERCHPHLAAKARRRAGILIDLLARLGETDG
jgi:hypothetical protein